VLKTRTIIKHAKSLKLNNIIQILTYSDSLLWGGYMMVNATAAIYLQDQIKTEPLEAISFGLAIYTLTRSIIQIPIAKFLDNRKEYTDEAYAIAIGCTLMAGSIFSYLFITQPWHLYLAQFVFGLGAASNMPAWRKTFAKFVDQNHEGLQYSVYDAITNMTIAGLTSLGGYLLAQTDNFQLLITLASGIILTSAVVSLFLTTQKDIN
jgi:MFS family permease